MAQKLRPSLADYVVAAISPALIVGLIGSLVFFLVEILYAGKYESRLLWTLFFFVAGIVLVARISIQSDLTRATFYGLGLCAVSWAALLAFIEYPRESAMADYAALINLFLIVLIWWCANKLTWDCTYIDEKRPASSQGLLAAAGLGAPPALSQDQADNEDRDKDCILAPSFWQRWAHFRERRKLRPHSPGLTVVWFSLAALPLFGLGQSLIPAGDETRRTFTFWLAAAYIGCALGLLLTTSFLGLRHYLRQRKLPMPKALSAIWLGLGGSLVLAFLFVGALLPRPYSETPIWDVKPLASVERKTSKHAIVPGDSGKGEVRPSTEKKPGEGNGGDASRDEDPKKGNSSDLGREDEGKQSSQANRRFPDTKIGHVLESILGFLKWLVFALIVLLVLAFLCRNALQYLGNFMPGARRLLERLNAWWQRLWKKRNGQLIAAVPIIEKPKRAPFTSFSNPFANGTSECLSVNKLVQYSFAALEAWASDRDRPRRPDETALEFASRLTNTFPSLDGEAQKLAILVVRVAYANSTLPADARQTLEHYWDRLLVAFPIPRLAD